MNAKHLFNLAALAVAGLLATAAEPGKSGKGPVRGAPIQKLTPAPAETKAGSTNAPAAPGAVQKDGEYLIVGFDRLADYLAQEQAPA